MAGLIGEPDFLQSVDLATQVKVISIWPRPRLTFLTTVRLVTQSAAALSLRISVPHRRLAFLSAMTWLS